MKKRFWNVYYWLMISYLSSFLFLWIYFYNKSGLTPTDTFVSTPDWIFFLNTILLEPLYVRYIECNMFTNLDNDGCISGNVLYQVSIQNYYFLLVVLALTLVRYIFTGNHIWNLPKSSNTHNRK